jgi:hypothetical protein
MAAFERQAAEVGQGAEMGWIAPQRRDIRVHCGFVGAERGEERRAFEQRGRMVGLVLSVTSAAASAAW